MLVAQNKSWILFSQIRHIPTEELYHIPLIHWYACFIQLYAHTDQHRWKIAAML